MFEIKNAIQSLDIREEHKGVMTDLITAELFNMCRYYKPVVTISKFKNENPADTRIWIEVLIELDVKDAALVQCRPFIDKGATLNAVADKIFMRKTYFLYEE